MQTLNQGVHLTGDITQVDRSAMMIRVSAEKILSIRGERSSFQQHLQRCMPLTLQASQLLQPV